MAPDERFIPLLGEWTGPEEVFATAWTAAGSARASLSVEPGPSGILLDYVETREDGRLVAHGVIAGDGFWWFDTYGFTPEQPGTVHWEDSTLVLTRSSERGRTVMRLTPGGDGLRQETLTAVPADGELRPLVLGRYAAV